MASLRRRGKRTYLSFRMFGVQYNRAVPAAQAEQIRRRADRILDDLASGALTLPPGVDPFCFVSGLNARQPSETTLTQVLACGEDDNDLAETTRLTMSIHAAHLKRILGGKARPESINLAVLQRYATQRMGEGVSGRTTLMELQTLRRQWNLAHRRGEAPPFCCRLGDLRLPRTSWSEPFRTREELQGAPASVVRECLYLDAAECDDLISQVESASACLFITPMVMTACRTGARRSELCRMLRRDLDLKRRTLSVRERKRVRGEDSFRVVDLSKRLAERLERWLQEHPGGPNLFTITGDPLTVDQAHDHLRRTLRKTTWDIIPGWHTFRHSFASILASKGVDPAIIDRWMGHQTREQRERYRHLFPADRRRAIDLIDGATALGNHMGEH